MFRLFCLTCPLYLRVSPTHSILFFFNDTATTEIYTLSLHDALPILLNTMINHILVHKLYDEDFVTTHTNALLLRSEEHTSELQSHSDLVCRLLLEKKKKNNNVP